MTKLPDILDKTYARLRSLAPPEVQRLIAHIEKEAKDPARVLRLTVRLAAFSLFAAMALSHDLWFQHGRLYGPSPIFGGVPYFGEGFNGTLYVLTMAVSAAVFFAPRLVALSWALLPVFVYFVMQDQLRGQFAIYVYLFNLFFAAALARKPDDAALDPLRWMTIGIYFWGGFYKLNLSFMIIGFPWFVAHWFPFYEVAQGFGVLVPFLESLIGIFLLIPATRWIGQMMALAMLVVVLLSIGPLGHNEALVVWPTNVYLDCLAIFLFAGNRRSLLDRAAWKKRLNAIALFLFILLPVLGMPDILGKHPAFKLYCCMDYGELAVGPQETMEFLPPSLEQRRAENANGRLTTSDVTMLLYQVGSGTFLSTDKPYIDGMRGFCPRLRRPQEARLHVIQAAHFRTTRRVERIYDLCADPPKLLEERMMKE